MLKVTLIKSLIGVQRKHILNVRGLGLFNLNQSVLVKDTPSVRGMLNKIAYLVDVRRSS